MTPEQRQWWHEKYTLLINKELMEVLDETESSHIAKSLARRPLEAT